MIVDLVVRFVKDRYFLFSEICLLIIYFITDI